VRAITKIFLILGTVCWLSTTGAFASDKTDFLIKGVSARPGAMGQAFVAVSDEADSIYWNPANLALVEVMNANTVHSSLNDFDMNTDMLSMAWPINLRESGFGLSVFRSSVGSIEIVPQAARPEVTGYFDSQEIGLMAGYGLKVREGLYLGATAKFMQSKIYSYKVNGVGLDLGLLYDVDDNWRFGLNLQNAVPVDLGADTIPFNAKFGFAYTSDNRQWTIAADMDTNVLDDSLYHVGAEFWVVPQLGLRIGSNDGNVTAGVGLRGFTSGWNFDYSYEDSEIGDNHKVSLLFDFDERPPKPQKIVKEKPAKKKDVAVTEIKAEPAKKAAPVVEKKKEEPAKAAPAKVEEPKVEQKKEAKPVVVAEKAPAPKVVKPAVALIDAYTFYEGDDIVSISYTDIRAGQDITIYKKNAKIADIKITDVGMLSSSGKVTKLYIDKIEDYMIGDQIGIK